MKAGNYTDYSRVNWADYPSKSTKVDAENLNHMDSRLQQHDQRLVKAETVVADRENVTLAVDSWAQSTTYSGYYEQSVSLSKEHTVNVEARIKPADIIPTATEKTNFGRLEEMLINNGLDTVTFLCKTRPSADVEAWIVG